MYERILVPLDGSAPADRALDEATRLAKLTGARLRLLHVLEIEHFGPAARGYADPSGEIFTALHRFADEMLQQRKAKVEAEGVAVETAVLTDTAGRVSELIVDDAKQWGAGLIVLGTHGRRGVRRLLLGSDAEHVARIARVPVLLVHDGSAPAE